MKKTVLLLLRVYKTMLSPFIGQSCRYFPTCSEYTHQAVSKYGIFKGLFLGTKRISRCHPFSKTTDFFDPLI